MRVMPSSSATAAAWQQRERGEIDAALRRKHAYFIRHPDIHDAADAGSGFEYAHAQRFANASQQCFLRCRDVDLLGTTEEVIRIEEAAHEVGVGHCRLRSATAVTGRSRIGAGAAGADGEVSAAVD